MPDMQLLEAAFNSLPVDYVPDSLEILGLAVLILQAVPYR